MDRYLTGKTIRDLRERKNMTQAELAGLLCVSDKAVSKWETGQGYPDVTLLEPLGAALGASVAELMCGAAVENANVGANMLRSRFYVCPVCGNTVHAMGEAHISCHGVTLPALVAEPAEGGHALHATVTGDELFVWADHAMGKEHHITFLAAVSDSVVQIARLYPEGPSEAHFRRSGVRELYLYCKRDALFTASLRGTLKRTEKASGMTGLG